MGRGGGYRSGPPRSGSVISLTPTGLPGRAAERLIKKKSSTKRSSGGCGGAGASALVQAGGHGAAGGSHRSPPPSSMGCHSALRWWRGRGTAGGDRRLRGVPVPGLWGSGRRVLGPCPIRGGHPEGWGLGLEQPQRCRPAAGQSAAIPTLSLSPAQTLLVAPQQPHRPPTHGHQGWAGCGAAGLSSGETPPPQAWHPQPRCAPHAASCVSVQAHARVVGVFVSRARGGSVPAACVWLLGHCGHAPACTPRLHACAWVPPCASLGHACARVWCRWVLTRALWGHSRGWLRVPVPGGTW